MIDREETEKEVSTGIRSSKKSLSIQRTIFINALSFVLLGSPWSCNGTSSPDSHWAELPKILNAIILPTFPARDFYVTDFGAIGDGQTDCTNAFKEAIAACNNSGGGRVVVSAGHFLTGAIYLQSNVNLHVMQGATVLFTTDPKKYLPVVYSRFEGVECMNYSPLIYAFEQENIAITGSGTLDGQASNENWWSWKGKEEFGWNHEKPHGNDDVDRLYAMPENGVPVEERIFGEGSYLRPNFIQTYKCKNVLIDGVTITRAPMWGIHPVLSENVTIQNVSVISHGPNNDGCNPESSKNVLIKNCYFDTGDDCIAIKSGRNADGRRVNVPSENIVVQKCTMKDGHGGVVIGSEMSGNCRNIFIEDCIMDSPNLDRALRVKTNSLRGGIVENIFMRNIKIGEVGDAIIRVNFNYGEGDVGSFTPVVRNIYVSNLTSKKSRYVLLLEGYERSPVSNMNLQNCRFDGVAEGNKLRHYENLTMKDVYINGELFSGVQLAFPGAEGYGRFTTGGRGGQVIEVTNLNDSGTGSLRAAIEASGARTIVFRLSGTIRLQSELLIKNGDITIAGQTAPGDGICLRDYPLIIDADNVIIRYLRVRLGDVNKLEEDAVSALFQRNIIIDHCSISWGIDEVATVRDNENTTVQWCIISESLNHSYHSKGDHGYGGIWGGKRATFHHNLLAHHTSRTPRFNGSRYHGEPEEELVDFRNNVIYNWGFNSAYGGEGGKHNIIGNFYKYGPATEPKNRIVEPWDDKGQWYVDKNFVFGFPEITANNWSGGVQEKVLGQVSRASVFPFASVQTHSAEEAYELVLANAGAVLPRRDAVDKRIVEEVRTGTATYGGIWGAGTGIVDSQADVGGWPALSSLRPPADHDHDGMADDWELAHDLNPSDPEDRNGDFDGDGYTNLEKYLNSLLVINKTTKN